jgi:Ca2+-binding RTX toxin-like protein
MAAGASLDASGILSIHGTDSADEIAVTAVTRSIQTSKVTWELLHDYNVRVTDSAGNLRRDALGRAVNLYFSRSQVVRIDVFAGGGDDAIDTSQTEVENRVRAGSGNDTITTGRANDCVWSEAGDDVARLGIGNDFFGNSGGRDLAYGSWGNDIFEGGSDVDRFYGEYGRDVLHGRDGNDVLSGGDDGDDMYGDDGADSMLGDRGEDSMKGSEGDDSLYGGSHNDLLDGGAGRDMLYGEGGNDKLRGRSGNDVLVGNDGADFLNGGSGLDMLYGGDGSDALMGGAGDDLDQLIGGNDADRFLEWSGSPSGSSEYRVDYSSKDAVIYARDAEMQLVVLASNVGETVFSAGTWAEAEVEALDEAFRQIQDRTGNTVLLKTNARGALSFFRAGEPITNGAKAATIGGWNSGGGRVTFTDHGTRDLETLKMTAVHEIGHNWDEESPFWDQWKQLSGWESNIPGVHNLLPPAGKQKSGDGFWWHNGQADFCREYGEMNPLEDWATMWEAYFGYGGQRVADKIDHLDTFFDHMAEKE